VVEWLAEEFKVLVIPGAACGFNGHIRVCYSNLSPERCREAAGRFFFLHLLYIRVCYSNLSPERCREAAGRFIYLFIYLFIATGTSLQCGAP
jgi:hypothetical protein